MKGYWIIFGAAVTDAQAQQEYGRLWGPIAEKYQATIKVLGATRCLRRMAQTGY
ncbi:hypothetical protein D9M72_08490 [compost metagenome]